MKERDLYIPVRNWLVDRGFTVHVEKFDADIVATIPDPTAMQGVRLVVVELKLGMTAKLLAQLAHRAGWADEVWAAIPLDPRTVKRANCRYHGYGLLCVWNGKVRKVLGAKRQPRWFVKRRAYRIKRLAGLSPAMEHEVAGLPSCAELRTQRLVAQRLSKCEASAGV